MNSIREHMRLPLLIGSCVLCIGGGTVTYRAVRAAVLEEFDYSLRTKAHDFATLTELENDGYEFEFADKRMPEFERSEHPEYFQVTRRDGVVLARSPSMKTEVLAPPDRTPSADPMTYRLVLPGGASGRAAVVALELNGTFLDIIVARDTVRLDRLLNFIAVGFSLTSLLLLLLLAVALNALVRRGLRPLNALADQVNSIHTEHLDPRFSAPGLPEELRPIALRLDQLLERVATALQRERYLTSAMAHELHTPVAELRAATEVALKWPDDPEATSSAIEQARAISLQMQRIVNALLSLSHYESGSKKARLEPVDISDLMTTLHHSFEDSFRGKAIQTHWISEEDSPMITDRAMLETILENLCRNAVEHTPEGGTFEFRIETVKGDRVITLANSQDALTNADLEHLFEPLWRKDPSRTGSAHIGLGLAIVERCVDVLDLRVNAALPSPDRFEITLTAPSGVQTRGGE